MSAFNAKNLSYNKQEPSFLRKLKAEHGGDRSNVQHARPKKDRLKTGDEDEDEPTIIDEQGESLGKEEWAEMLRKEREGAEGKDEEGESKEGGMNGRKGHEEQELSREKQPVAEIGGSKKRRAGKVVGEAVASEEQAEEPKDMETKVDKKDASSTTTTTTTKKKKAKKIKLSFDEPDAG